MSLENVAMKFAQVDLNAHESSYCVQQACLHMHTWNKGYLYFPGVSDVCKIKLATICLCGTAREEGSRDFKVISKTRNMRNSSKCSDNLVFSTILGYYFKFKLFSKVFILIKSWYFLTKSASRD